MADWYVSAIAWNAIPQFAVSHAYSVGNIVRPLATPATNQQNAYRCTTAGTSGTSEASWSGNVGDQTTQGGAIFTNVSGQSTYGWSAAMGSLYSANNRPDRAAVGDRVFVASDHTENYNNSWGFNYTNGAVGLVQIISVNRAGSVPPAGADYVPGATLQCTAGATGYGLDNFTDTFWSGIKFDMTPGGNIGVSFNGGGMKNGYFKNCVFNLGTGATSNILASNNPNKIVFDNTPIIFGATGQYMNGSGYAMDFLWINTPVAVQGIAPSKLFNIGGNGIVNYTLRGVDVSAVTGILAQAQSYGTFKLLLDSCKIAPGVTRYVWTNENIDEVELINCFDGTNVVNERHTPGGDVVVDRSVYLTSGTQDDIGNYSLRLSSSGRNDKYALLLDAFGLDVESAAIGASKTATIEVNSPLSLYNDEIRVLLEYMAGALLYTAWNPSDKSAGITLSGNNLIATQSSGANGVRSALALSGKMYFEITIGSIGGGTNEYGIASASAALTSATTAQYAVVGNAGGGQVYTNGSYQTSIGAINVGSVVCVAVDVPNQLIWFRVGAGAWNAGGTANPATGVGGYSFSSLTGVPYAFYGPGFGSDSATANFGPTFANSLPSGFTGVGSLDTTNSIASMADSGPANALATPTVLPSSSNTWVGSPASTWNPSDLLNAQLSSGNLQVVALSTSCGARGIASQSSGKFYIEYPSCTGSQGGDGYGLSHPGIPLPYQPSVAGAMGMNGFGVPYANGTSPTSGGSSGINFATGFGLAIDFGAGLWWVYNSGFSGSHWSNGGNPATGAGGWSLNGLTGPLVPYCNFQNYGSGQGCIINLGGSPFTVGTCPTGFTPGWPLTLTKQLLQVAFTPQRAGRVRGLVRLGKPSATAWINPQIAIT